MQLSLRFFQTCRDKDHLESIMGWKTSLMEHMVEDLMMDIGQTWMTLLGMEYSWIHLIGEAVDMGFILVLVWIGITVIIIIILTKGMTEDICQMRFGHGFRKNYLLERFDDNKSNELY